MNRKMFKSNILLHFQCCFTLILAVLFFYTSTHLCMNKLKMPFGIVMVIAHQYMIPVFVPVLWGPGEFSILGRTSDAYDQAGPE